MTTYPTITIIGGGLAGCEAAWQSAIRGINVDLYEMRPFTTTEAHVTADLAELVCSNSLGSIQSNRASGILLNELIKCNSLLIECAVASSVPAGNALAVDRGLFSRTVTHKIETQPNIKVIRREITDLPSGPIILASGPLTSPGLAQTITKLTGEDSLFFYDAIAPIINIDSINMEIAFRGSRFGNEESGEGDYINCPLSKEEYEVFITNLISAETVKLRDFERFDNTNHNRKEKYFEGCLPVEILAKRGDRALAFGPMRPVGLINPRTGKGAYAIVQLRRDNVAGNLYNMVGFQTNLTYAEQERVFRSIPGLETADFIRLGQMHRNTFIASPKLLLPTLQFKSRKDLFFAGQITGVEGYMGNIGTGIVASWNMVRLIRRQEPIPFPSETMLGSLCHYISHAAIKEFQPMKANLGILPNLEQKIEGKLQRAERFSKRSASEIDGFINTFFK